MNASVFLLIILALLFTFGDNTAFTTDFFVVKPDKEIYSDEGSDVTLEWQFHIGHWSSSPIKVREFLFGIWEPPGFVQNKILAVDEHNVVLEQRNFERKVDWSGNIANCSKCTAKVKLYNLTIADFKTYGIEVEPVNLERSPLSNWVKLVKFEPAEIIKWTPSAEAEQGKATAVECKATGKPTPFVTITRKNLTLCNSTGQCVYKIPAANKSYEGQYLCFVQQSGNSSQIKHSLNLTVIDISDDSSTTKCWDISKVAITAFFSALVYKVLLSGNK